MMYYITGYQVLEIEKEMDSSMLQSIGTLCIGRQWQADTVCDTCVGFNKIECNETWRSLLTPSIQTLIRCTHNRHSYMTSY